MLPPVSIFFFNFLVCFWPCILFRHIQSGHSLLPIFFVVIEMKPLWASFFPPFLAAPWRMVFPGQESDLSHNCNPCNSCSNDRSLNPLCWAGDQTCVLAWCYRDTANPLLPQWELGSLFIVINSVIILALHMSTMEDQIRNFSASHN